MNGFVKKGKRKNAPTTYFFLTKRRIYATILVKNQKRTAYMKKTISIIILISALMLVLASCGGEEKCYEALADYIESRGTADENTYVLKIGESEKDGAVYTRFARKYSAKIELELVISTSAEELRSFTIVINKGDFDSYKWYYSSFVTESSMNGLIVAEDFQRAAGSLGYMSANSSDEYTVASMAAQAKGMCNYLLDSLAEDLSELGITAADFGFEDYED